MPIETISYAGWNRCLRIFNQQVEALVTTEVGPRILRFGRLNGDNLLHEVPAHQGLTGGSEWRAYGGHRLWHAPEAKPRTYSPDNDPVNAEVEGDRVRLTQPVEPGTGIQKQLEIRLDPVEARLEILHRIINLNPWSVEFAPWSITMMAPGGIAIVPREPYAPHPDAPAADRPSGPPTYLPVQSLALWSYTALNDSRWRFLDEYILMKQDRSIASPIKFGVSNRQGWCAYAKAGELFLKRFPWAAGATYPDLGCNTEIYADAAMLEVESLGPLARIEPGECLEHVEEWIHIADMRLSLENIGSGSTFPELIDGVLS